MRESHWRRIGERLYPIETQDALNMLCVYGRVRGDLGGVTVSTDLSKTNFQTVIFEINISCSDKNMRLGE